MTSEVVNHVTLRAEALAAVLGALEGTQVVVYTHVHRQVVSVVEDLVARGHWAGKVWPALVICKVSLKTTLKVELLLTAQMGALVAHLRFLFIVHKGS